MTTKPSPQRLRPTASPSRRSNPTTPRRTKTPRTRKRKEAAAARLREREKEDKYTAIERKQAELEKKIEADKIERQQAAEADRYIREVTSTATAKYPLIAHLMKHAPDDIGDGLQTAFERLQAKTGRAPKPAEVVAEYDRKERTRLKALGVDVDAVLKIPAKKTTTTAKVNGAAKPANTNAALSKDEILASIPAD